MSICAPVARLLAWAWATLLRRAPPSKIVQFESGPGRSGEQAGLRRRKLLLKSVKVLWPGDNSDLQSRVVCRLGFLHRRLTRPESGYLLQQVRTLLQGAINQLLHRIIHALRRAERSHRLDLHRYRRRGSQRRGQVSASDLIGAHCRLQIELCLCGCALRFQHVRTCSQSIRQPILSRRLYRLRVGQIGLSRLLLRGGAEHAVISLLNLVNDFAMRIVEAEVGG